MLQPAGNLASKEAGHKAISVNHGVRASKHLFFLPLLLLLFLFFFCHLDFVLLRQFHSLSELLRCNFRRRACAHREGSKISALSLSPTHSLKRYSYSLWLLHTPSLCYIPPTPRPTPTVHSPPKPDTPNSCSAKNKQHGTKLELFGSQ